MKIAFLALVAGLAAPSFAEEKLSEFDALVKSYDESELNTVAKFEEYKPKFLALADRLEGDAALEQRYRGSGLERHWEAPADRARRLPHHSSR